MSDQLYYNGDIITMEDELYTKAVLVRDGKIIGVGDKDELVKSGDSEVIFINLEGKTLMPSFIDAHSHFSGYANSLLQVSLEESVSFDEIVEAIQGFIRKNQVKPGEWVLARSYDHNHLKEKKHPTKELLDIAAPNNPCVIQHQSGHMGVFNTLALKGLGITVDTPPIEGGLIATDNGELTGYLEESAFVTFIKQVPLNSMDDIFAALNKAQNNYASYGITTVQEGFIIDQLSDILLYLQSTNQMKVDLIGYLDITDATNLKSKFADCIKQYKNRIKIGGYKTFLDGSAQGRTAWMLTPYLGSEKNYYGYPNYKDEQLEPLIEKAILDDMQLLIHCNGDAATNQYITQYKKALEHTNAKNNLRPVIIHAQLLQKAQLDDVKQLKMIPSFFVAHVYYWGDTHIENFGKERASEISVAHSALDKGILFTFHQDAPVIEPNMLETVWCAVNRITKAGVSIGPNECISPLDALKAITINAAYQYFEEDRKGSIKKGKLADFVILDKNPLKVDHMDIRDIKVLETLKEGVSIYQRKNEE